MLSNACSQRLHQRCPGAHPSGGVRCDCRCHVSASSSEVDIRLTDVNALKEADMTVAAALGFHPLLGGRRLGELRCSRLSPDGKVWLEITGTWVSVAQAKAIRTILVEEQ